MILRFRAWLEDTERKAPEDKGKDKDDDDATPMDLFGGEEEELNIDPDTLKHIYQTEPQVGAHIDFDDLDWKVMPFMVKNMSTHGADIETFDDEDVPAQTYKHKHKHKNMGRHRGHLHRKDLADLIGQGWQAATAAAAGGGAPGGAGGMPPI